MSDGTSLLGAAALAEASAVTVSLMIALLMEIILHAGSQGVTCISICQDSCQGGNSELQLQRQH
jgi:hypothetical protein